MTTTNKSYPQPANDNACPAYSLKDLLCDQCGKVEAMNYGLCVGCESAARAEMAEREDDWKGDRF